MELASSSSTTNAGRAMPTRRHCTLLSFSGNFLKGPVKTCEGAPPIWLLWWGGGGLGLFRVAAAAVWLPAGPPLSSWAARRWLRVWTARPSWRVGPAPPGSASFLTDAVWATGGVKAPVCSQVDAAMRPDGPQGGQPNTFSSRAWPVLEVCRLVSDVGLDSPLRTTGCWSGLGMGASAAGRHRLERPSAYLAHTIMLNTHAIYVTQESRCRCATCKQQFHAPVGSFCPFLCLTNKGNLTIFCSSECCDDHVAKGCDRQPEPKAAPGPENAEYVTCPLLEAPLDGDLHRALKNWRDKGEKRIVPPSRTNRARPVKQIACRT